MNEVLDAIIEYIPRSRVKADLHQSLIALFSTLRKSFEGEDEELVSALLHCTQIALPIIKKDKVLYNLYVNFAKEV